jgi:hypothetical protein
MEPRTRGKRDLEVEGIHGLFVPEWKWLQVPLKVPGFREPEVPAGVRCCDCCCKRPGSGVGANACASRGRRFGATGGDGAAGWVCRRAGQITRARGGAVGEASAVGMEWGANDRGELPVTLPGRAAKGWRDN